MEEANPQKAKAEEVQLQIGSGAAARGAGNFTRLQF